MYVYDGVSSLINRISFLLQIFTPSWQTCVHIWFIYFCCWWRFPFSWSNFSVPARHGCVVNISVNMSTSSLPVHKICTCDRLFNFVFVQEFGFRFIFSWLYTGTSISAVSHGNWILTTVGKSQVGNNEPARELPEKKSWTVGMTYIRNIHITSWARAIGVNMTIANLWAHTEIECSIGWISVCSFVRLVWF